MNAQLWFSETRFTTAGYSTSQLFDPAHPARAVLRRPVIRRTPTSAEEMLWSLKQVVPPGSAGGTSEKGPSMNAQ